MELWATNNFCCRTCPFFRSGWRTFNRRQIWIDYVCYRCLLETASLKRKSLKSISMVGPSLPWGQWEGNYVYRNSQRILVEAAYIGVFRREESSLRRIPQSSLPVPKFAAKVVPCSYPLIGRNLQYLQLLHKPFINLQRKAWNVENCKVRKLKSGNPLPGPALCCQGCSAVPGCSVVLWRPAARPPVFNQSKRQTALFPKSAKFETANENCQFCFCFRCQKPVSFCGFWLPPLRPLRPW